MQVRDGDGGERRGGGGNYERGGVKGHAEDEMKMAAEVLKSRDGSEAVEAERVWQEVGITAMPTRRPDESASLRSSIEVVAQAPASCCSASYRTKSHNSFIRRQGSGGRTDRDE